MSPDEKWLRRAIELSRKCPVSHAAFSVGCVIVDLTGSRELSHGYSRENGPTLHAEESALAKLPAGAAINATLYSSLEPCSVRKSGRRPCVDHILAAGISRVVYALREPSTFVTCDGHAQLERAGIKVVQMEELNGMGQMVREINAHIGTR